MSEIELERLFKTGSKDLDQRQRQRIRELKGLERALFEVIARRITEELDAGNGSIRTGRGSASINQLIDLAFKELAKAGLNDFYKKSVTDLFAILGNNDQYNAGLFSATSKAGDKRFKAMRGEVDRIMRKRIGIDDNGRLVKNGLLSKLLTTDAIKTQLMETLNAGVQAGIPMNKLVRLMEITVKGTRDNTGVLERQFKPLVFDTYQAFDRASNNVYADKLKLSAFLYLGGLIETSREFCEKHNGKVFTVEEAETQWPKDPTLPKTKKEKDTGILAYNPTVDLGRWNCRHRTRYITPALAIKFRPELKAYFGRSGNQKIDPSTKTKGNDSISNVENRIRSQGFESAAVYDKDGNFVFFKDGEASQVSFTPDELLSIKGGTLTHNHPSGRSFSWQDFQLAMIHDGAEIRAAYKGGVYVMRIPKKISYLGDSVNRGFGLNDQRALNIIRQAYNDADRATRSMIEDGIVDGSITTDQANATHHHEIWMSLSREMGFEYERILIP